MQVRFYARANSSGQYPSIWTGTAQVDMNELNTTSISCWGFRSRLAEAAAWRAAEVVKFVDVHAIGFLGVWTCAGVYFGPRVTPSKSKVTPWPRKILQFSSGRTGA